MTGFNLHFSELRLRWAPLVVVVLLLSACGVTAQDTAEPLPANALPPPVTIPGAGQSSPADSNVMAPPASETSPAASRLRIWLVRDDGLIAVETDLPRETEPNEVIQAIGSGVAPAEAEQGARTIARDPLTSQSLVFIAQPPQVSAGVGDFSQDQGAVTVGLSASFGALPPSEQVLLLGQVVLSLAGAGYPSVSFTDDFGNPLAVPLPDGRLLDTPASARDFATLIARP